MKVNEMMTGDPCTISPDAALDRAMALMDGRDLRHLPVVEDAAVVGVVSDRDLLEATGWLRADRRRDRFEPSDEGRSRTIRDVMRFPAITVGADDTVFTVAVKFVTDRIGCLPVLEDGLLVGIVTETDLLAAYRKACTDGLVSADDDPPVSEPMTGSPMTAQWHTPLAEALERTRKAQVRHLPILEGDDIVGMVSDRDLRRAVGMHRVDDTMMEEIMTKDVATVAPDTPLCEAARILTTRHIGALPVVDGGSLIGIVSVKDLVYHCMANLREPEQSA